jgi:dipeptidyl aminopeptidase/acylaminoacyl peptidase
MRRCALLTLVFAASTVLMAQKRPFDIDAMLRLKRIAEPQLSPDGKMIAFTVTTVDVTANTKPKQIYVVPLEGGDAPRQITREGSNERPRWTPDSKYILYVSTQGGSQQIWRMEPNGLGAKAITSIPTEASGVSVSPDGKRLVFLSSVYPECLDEACNKRRLDEENASKLKARVYTSLLYRHWNEYSGKRRSHLMSCSIDGGPVKDLTPGNRDVPPFSLGGPDDYTIAPDSKEVAFVMNGDENLATSTNSDIYVVPIEGGETKKITSNTGADLSPAYSPDGKWLAYRSQAKAGYESDRWRLVVLERTSGRYEAITDGVDRNVTSFTWTPDSKRFFFVTEDRGRHNVQQIAATGGGLRPVITGPSSIDDVQFTPDGKSIVYTEMSGSRPTEIMKATSGGSGSPVTRLNDSLLSDYAINPLEELWVEGAEKTRVHSFVVKPPGFDPRKKNPVLFLIHGGPQGAWGESWSYRWNPQVFAAAGFVVVMPNPRGSTGYGQKFTDDINSDWGGKVYEDIMATVDHVAAQPWADAERFAAAGGSYGGYMVNWLLGHTTRFKAFVSHAGVYDLRSMAAETEELWFPMWEFRGMPWDNPEVYEKWSPSYFVREFRTPTLVLHGELDYRVPVGQGMQLFTGLQLQKVPSKMVLFPDEGHWIGKPQNTVLWYQTFLDWIGEWTRKPAAVPPAATPPAN